MFRSLLFISISNLYTLLQCSTRFYQLVNMRRDIQNMIYAEKKSQYAVFSFKASVESSIYNTLFCF